MFKNTTASKGRWDDSSKRNYRILEREHSTAVVFGRKIVLSDVLLNRPEKRRDCDRIRHRYITKKFLFCSDPQTWRLHFYFAEHPLSLCGLCWAGRFRRICSDQSVRVTPIADGGGAFPEPCRAESGLAQPVRRTQSGRTGADPLLESTNSRRNYI